MGARKYIFLVLINLARHELRKDKLASGGKSYLSIFGIVLYDLAHLGHMVNTVWAKFGVGVILHSLLYYVGVYPSSSLWTTS